MNLSWATTVLLVPCVVVLTAGVFYLYGAVLALLSKTSVRNKVVIITDALSELGKGGRLFQEQIPSAPSLGFSLSLPQSVQACSTEEEPGWSSVGRAGRSWKSFRMSWRAPPIPRWSVDFIDESGNLVSGDVH